MVIDEHRAAKQSSDRGRRVEVMVGERLGIGSVPALGAIRNVAAPLLCDQQRHESWPDPFSEGFDLRRRVRPRSLGIVNVEKRKMYAVGRPDGHTIKS